MEIDLDDRISKIRPSIKNDEEEEISYDEYTMNHKLWIYLQWNLTLAPAKETHSLILL